MTVVVFTDTGGVPWKVWRTPQCLVFHAKTGARRELPLDGVEIPALELLQEQPRTLQTLCELAHGRADA